MTLLSQSQTNNIEMLMARIKERAFAAEQESQNLEQPKGVFSKPQAPASTTSDSMALNTIRMLRQKAEAAMAEQPEIYLEKFDVKEFTSKKQPKVEDTSTPVDSEAIDAAVQSLKDDMQNGIGGSSDDMMVVDPVVKAGVRGIMSPVVEDFMGSDAKQAIDDMSDMEILARTIEAEAAAESYSGKIGVGATIANRVSSGKYGDNIKGVILKKGQFSPWNSYTGYAKGEQGKDMLNLKPSKESYRAAAAILAGDYEDPTGGATHYVNESVSQPDWLDEMKGRKVGTTKIGRHTFGNADSEKTYDGVAWAKTYAATRTSPRPKARP